MNQPGGNLTGIYISQNQARRLQLLLEVAPGSKRIFAPFNPEDAAPTSTVAQINDLAISLGIEIVEGQARDDAEVAELLTNIPADFDAIIMLPDSTVNSHLAELLAVALERNLPVSGPSIAQVEQGALIAYGIIHANAGAQAAPMADQILKGSDPGSLPVQTAEFYLGLNVVTAEAIGIEIPISLLQSAEVIVRTDV